MAEDGWYEDGDMAREADRAKRTAWAGVAVVTGLFVAVVVMAAALVLAVVLAGALAFAWAIAVMD
ncbi:hypothetical protein ABTX60_16970 [Streptomyces sp. NPDC126510]|uniref:hypothetical protein n=1 Tax=Streptomyces sp. NPDC126510 TaxID=3155317 RepID=UPI003320900F